jgi:hypothetical protein
VSADNWVRTFNLIASAILFYGSFRAQAWLRRQAAFFDRAAVPPAAPLAAEHAPLAAQPATDNALGKSSDFTRALRNVAATPYFDRWAYILLCVGFGISVLTGLYDLYSHSSLACTLHQLTPQTK